MRKKRSIVWRILPWVILLAALAALVLFVFVPIYSPKEDTFGEPTVVFSSEDLSGTLNMENDFLLFEMDQGTTQFTVTDKKTGKTWSRSKPGSLPLIRSMPGMIIFTG